MKEDIIRVKSIQVNGHVTKEAPVGPADLWTTAGSGCRTGSVGPLSEGQAESAAG